MSRRVWCPAAAIILRTCRLRPSFKTISNQVLVELLIEEEVEGIYNVWKKPMAGFFSYGEVGQQQDKISHFYNETCSLVLLKERN